MIEQEKVIKMFFSDALEKSELEKVLEAASLVVDKEYIDAMGKPPNPSEDMKNPIFRLAILYSITMFVELCRTAYITEPGTIEFIRRSFVQLASKRIENA